MISGINVKVVGRTAPWLLKSLQLVARLFFFLTGPSMFQLGSFGPLTKLQGGLTPELFAALDRRDSSVGSQLPYGPVGH